MSVTSYLALYITILGWQQYQNLWGIVVGTGLIYLPFVAIILKSTVEPFASMGAKPACQIALRRMFMQIIGALLVITFAALPAVHLDPKVLHYEPLCTPNAQKATPGNTGTTYDNVFPVPTNVKVPMFWYLVMAVSNGFTHAASIGLSCAPINYREVHSELNVANIQDPYLQKQAARFYSDCYVPAYSKYISGDLSKDQQAQIDNTLKKHGKDDVKWMGSQAFLTTPGFYSAFKASKPVKGFAFDPARDAEEGQVPGHSEWGEPTCSNWWNDVGNGVHEKLAQALPVGVMQAILHLGKSKAELQDAAIRTLIVHSFANQSMQDFSRGYQSVNDNLKGDYISRSLGEPIGVAFHNMTFLPKLHLLINALPLIQGALLFAMYVFLALAIPFSSYRMSFCVTGAIIIFSVIFCSYIWNLVAWFDNYLIQALYPSLHGIKGMGGILNSWFGQPIPHERFTNMVIGTLYIVLPFFWMIMMGWCGFAVSHFMASVTSGMSGSASAAGGEAGGAAKTAISTGIGVAKSGT
jgi:hypothetical protein